MFAVLCNSVFNVTPLLYDEYLRNGTRHRHSYNDILIGTYPSLQFHFEWPWMTSRNIQWHETSRGLSATAELLVLYPRCTVRILRYRWVRKKLEWCDYLNYLTVKKLWWYAYRPFRQNIGVRDGRTDGWTDSFQEHSPRCRPIWRRECERRNSDHRNSNTEPLIGANDIRS